MYRAIEEVGYEIILFLREIPSKFNQYLINLSTY